MATYIKLGHDVYVGSQLGLTDMDEVSTSIVTNVEIRRRPILRTVCSTSNRDEADRLKTWLSIAMRFIEYSMYSKIGGFLQLLPDQPIIRKQRLFLRMKDSTNHAYNVEVNTGGFDIDQFAQFVEMLLDAWFYPPYIEPTEKHWA